MKLKTPHLQIVYPSHLESYALKTGRFTESIYQANSEPFGESKPITLVLNPYTAVSNGYVTLLPRKSEWYLQPYRSSYFGNLAWYKLLGIHEYRHVFQIDGLNKGFIKWSKVFSGNLGESILLGWAYPLWLFEGDATYAETRFSGTGRGYSSIFQLPFITIANEYKSKDLNYYKIYFGSYKRYYPSHYHLGYFLVNYLYDNYPQKELWKKIYKKSSVSAFIPGSFQLWLKKHTGLNYQQLTRKVLEGIKGSRRSEAFSNISFLPLKRPKSYTSDIYPHIVGKDSLYFLRSGFDELPTIYFYSAQEQSLKKIKTTGTGYFTANSSLLAWAESKPHHRWGKSVYTRIRVYNPDTHEDFYLTTAGKYQSPSLWKKGNLIVTVRYDSSVVPHLEIWDADTRKRVHTFDYPQFESIRQPYFSENGKSIVFTALHEDKGSAVWNQSLQENTPPQRLTPYFTRTIVQYPHLYHGRLYLENDNDHLHLSEVNLQNGKVYRLTRSHYGMHTFDISGDSVCFSEYTAKGFRIRCEKLTAQKIAEQLASEQGYKELQKYLQPDTSTYIHGKYSHLLSYLNPHTWLWGIGVIADSEYVAGAFLTADDVLNENHTEVGFIATSNHQWSIFGAWEYRRYFPVLGLRYTSDKYFMYKEPFRHMTVYMRIPLNFSSGIWKRYLQPRLEISSTRYGNLQFYPYGGEISFSVSRERAYRHTDSRWGTSMHLRYRAEPVSVSENMDGYLSIQWPGLFKNDVFKYEGIFYHHTGTYPFRASAQPVRGIYINTPVSWNASHFTYHAPLAYPDWGWRRIFNLKRIRYKLFYDIARFKAGTFQSTGIDLIGDWNFFGNKMDIPLGMRFAYVMPENRLVSSLIIWGISW